MGYLNGTGLQQFWRKVKAYITTHTENRGNPHAVTKAQIGLGNVDNTSDLKKPVSTAQQTAMDTHYRQATGYTDTKIAALINGAPSTLDTLGEIATAMQKNENVVNALDQAIGSKASEADFEGHRRDKSNPHSVTKNQIGLGNVPNVSTNEQTPTYTEATTLAELTSGEKLSAAFGKLKLVTKNVISLARLMGTTDITGIGNGTVTGALNSLNNNLGNAVNVVLGVAGDADKLAEQIYSKWSGISGSYGCVRFSNGTTMYTGTYIKYSDSIGSMTLTDAEGNAYVWHIINGVYHINNLINGTDYSNAITIYDHIFKKLRFKAVEKGKNVVINGIFAANENGALNVNHLICTLPAAIKPPAQIDFTGCIQDGNYKYIGGACMSITNAGAINVSSNISLAGRYVQFSICYDL